MKRRIPLIPRDELIRVAEILAKENDMAKEKSKPALSADAQALNDAADRSAEIAKHVRQISAGLRSLTKSGLNRRALVVLLQDITAGVSRTDINAVLDGLQNLDRSYLTLP